MLHGSGARPCILPPDSFGAPYLQDLLFLIILIILGMGLPHHASDHLNCGLKQHNIHENLFKK